MQTKCCIHCLLNSSASPFRRFVFAASAPAHRPTAALSSRPALGLQSSFPFLFSTSPCHKIPHLPRSPIRSVTCTHPHTAGITAPGLRALAAAISADGFCTFSVSAPSGERSAQSHCITLGKHLHAWELPVEGAEEAFAVDGTPGAVPSVLSGRC